VISLSFGLPPSLWIDEGKKQKDPYSQALFTSAELTQEKFEPIQDDVSAFFTYSLGGLTDPKVFLEASAYRMGPGPLGYVGGFVRASVLGMGVAGLLGWLFDPLDLREGSFSEDFPPNMVGLEVTDPKMITWGSVV